MQKAFVGGPGRFEPARPIEAVVQMQQRKPQHVAGFMDPAAARHYGGAAYREQLLGGKIDRVEPGRRHLAQIEYAPVKPLS